MSYNFNSLPPPQPVDAANLPRFDFGPPTGPPAVELTQGNRHGIVSLQVANYEGENVAYVDSALLPTGLHRNGLLNKIRRVFTRETVAIAPTPSQELDIDRHRRKHLLPPPVEQSSITQPNFPEGRTAEWHGFLNYMNEQGHPLGNITREPEVNGEFLVQPSHALLASLELIDRVSEQQGKETHRSDDAVLLFSPNGQYLGTLATKSFINTVQDLSRSPQLSPHGPRSCGVGESYVMSTGEGIHVVSDVAGSMTVINASADDVLDLGSLDVVNVFPIRTEAAFELTKGLHGSNLEPYTGIVSGRNRLQ